MLLIAGAAIDFADDRGTTPLLGAVWTQRNPATRPAARTGPAMTFDPVLGRIVLHGGLTLAGLQGDLWSFDGVNWQPIATGNPGPAAYQHTLHHDPRTNELWALAGIPAELWILGGGTWRSGPALPFVATAGPTQATVDPGTGGVLRCGWGTQVWDRVQWRSITTQPAPPGRIFAAMWNDGTYAWLFGGWNTLLGITYNDTWRWDGVSWMRVVGPSPAIRHDTAVAYDSVRGEAVLFGGFTQSALSDTWTFDGAAWHFQNPATRPPVRWQHGMAFDLARGRMVLFGGTGLTLSQLRNDTWEWDGVNWAQVVTPVSPPAVGTAALCFDHRHQRIVMSQSGTQNVAAWTPALWTYDGVAWTPLAVAPALPLQPVHSWMTLPGELDATVVDGSSVQLLTDRPPIVTKLGTGCGSQPPDLWVRTPPRLGASQFAFEIEHAPASQVVALLLATAPGSLVVGGCSIGVHAGGSALFLATDARGAAMSPLPLPAGPALLGVSVFAQAFALAPGSTNGFTASATVRASIGMR
ncbi:MAG: hypothetical protein IT455_18715 [Planctomycetes bacterium]|nr:hypothetical protein [Planctomycetota bacterium]